MIIIFLLKLFRLWSISLILAIIGGCNTLHQTPLPSFYSLDNARIKTRAASQVSSMLSQVAPTMTVNLPHAVSGFDSKHIIYVREPHQLEYYAHNEWVDTPARMLGPLVIDAVESSGAFRAVVLMPSAVAGNLRLETEIVRLQHELGSHPGRVRFTLRAYIVDNTTREMLAWREFDETITTLSENPYGMVVAANRVVQSVLEHLANFCSETASKWPHPSS
jgi:cholesterol transport system auxiliary component